MIMVFTPNPRFGDTCRHPKKCSKQKSKITQGTSFSLGHPPKASTKGWLSFSRTTGFGAVSSPWLSMLTMVGNPTQKNRLAKFLLPLIPNGLHGQEVNRLRMYFQLIKKTWPNTCSTTSSEQCPGRSGRKHLEHSEVAPGGPHSEFMGYQGHVMDVIQIYLYFDTPWICQDPWEKQLSHLRISGTQTGQQHHEERTLSALRR